MHLWKRWIQKGGFFFLLWMATLVESQEPSLHYLFEEGKEVRYRIGQTIEIVQEVPGQEQVNVIQLELLLSYKVQDLLADSAWLAFTLHGMHFRNEKTNPGINEVEVTEFNSADFSSEKIPPEALLYALMQNRSFLLQVAYTGEIIEVQDVTVVVDDFIKQFGLSLEDGKALRQIFNSENLRDSLRAGILLTYSKDPVEEQEWEGSMDWNMRASTPLRMDLHYRIEERNENTVKIALSGLMENQKSMIEREGIRLLHPFGELEGRFYVSSEDGWVEEAEIHSSFKGTVEMSLEVAENLKWPIRVQDTLTIQRVYAE